MKRFGRECRSWMSRYKTANAHRAIGLHPWFHWRCEMDYRLPTVSIPASSVIVNCDVKLTASDIDGLLNLPATGTVTVRPSEVIDKVGL